MSSERLPGVGATSANGPPTKRVRVEQCETPANSCITFHLLHPEQRQLQVPESRSFHPEFTHQLFGDDEVIKGYIGLAIDVWICSQTYHTFIDVKYERKLKGAVDVMSIFEQHFPAGLWQNEQEFFKAIKTAHIPATQLGEEVSSQQVNSTKITVHRTKLCGAEKTLQELHTRLEPLLLFFIDGASFIERDDARWDVYFVVKTEAKSSSVVGFATGYHFFAWPDKMRFRLSQILVLPPFQRNGIGRQLLQSVYKAGTGDKVVDITFEDPSEDLQALRDKVDLDRMKQCEWLASAAAKMAVSAGAEGPGSLAIPPALALQAQQELLMTKQQVRRVWELLLYSLDTLHTPQGLAAFRALVRKRLEGSIESGRKSAEYKQVIEVAGSGFIMLKSGVKGNTVALETHVEATEEERQAVVDDWIQVVQAIVG